MLGQQRAGGVHDPVELIGSFAAGKVSGDGLPRYVVGRGGVHALGALAPHQQVAIADAGIELERLVRYLLVHVGDDAGRRLAVDVSGGIVRHRHLLARAGQGDQVHAEGDIVRCQLHAHRGGLQRGTAGVVAAGIVTEQAQVAHVRSGRIAVGYRVNQSELPAARHPIESGGACRLQRRGGSRLRPPAVAHAIALNDHVLHPTFHRMWRNPPGITVAVTVPWNCDRDYKRRITLFLGETREKGIIVPCCRCPFASAAGGEGTMAELWGGLGGCVASRYPSARRPASPRGITAGPASARSSPPARWYPSGRSWGGIGSPRTAEADRRNARCPDDPRPRRV